MELLQRLGLSLFIGLLIGTERGWQERSATEGERVAGIRTFGLLGLLGGLWALLAQELGTILFGFSFLHGWLKKLEETELFAALKLLLISVVILPWLPDRGYGPWNALNPHDIWLFVVLIAGISFAGYFAMKLAGSTRGIIVRVCSAAWFPRRRLR